MGLYDETVKVGRRTMVLFFIIDTSGSMRGAKIGQVNAAIEGILPKIKEISKENADAAVSYTHLDEYKRQAERQRQHPAEPDIYYSFRY